jgi:hypothetical protein
MDLTYLQYQFSQASPVAQATLTASVLLLVTLSAWFWSVALDRLFDSLRARRLKGRAAAAPGGRA